MEVFCGQFFNIVILSGAGTSRSEVPAESKDPYSLRQHLKEFFPRLVRHLGTTAPGAARHEKKDAALTSQESQRCNRTRHPLGLGRGTKRSLDGLNPAPGIHQSAGSQGVDGATRSSKSRNVDHCQELPVRRRSARALTGVVVGGHRQLAEGGLQLLHREPAVSVAA